MNQEDMNEARTNPEFLKFLEEQEVKAKEEKNIGELYQVLDTLLVLNLDENRIHSVYQEILKIAFDQVEDRLANGKKLSLDDNDIYFVRSFYEHAIEKWSVENFKGAKELFFVLTQIIEDETLQEAMSVHMVATAKEIDIDTFYQDAVVDSDNLEDERYGYFIIDFNYNKEEYLNENSDLIKELYNELKHLIDG